MSIYINKNNQQSGPFDDAKVLEMLKSGELSPNDSAIRQGEKEWQNLSVYFPNAGNAAPVAAQAAPSAPKKSRKNLLLGCGGFLIVGILIAGVLGFLAIRNLAPARDKTDIPDKVAYLQLSKEFPVKGNVWGTEVFYFGEYVSSSDGLTYLLNKYSGESAAIEKFKSETCKMQDIKRGDLKDKSGNQVGEFLYCGGTLHFRNKLRVVTIYNFTLLTERKLSDTSDLVIIEFVKNLPFNSELDMSGFASAYPTLKTEKRTQPNNSAAVL